MSVTLAQLLERQIQVAWFESVAIVQGLCAAVIERGGDQGAVPELRHIAITAAGEVTLGADGPTNQPAVSRAGRVLTALTPHPQMPVPLRLLALTAVSPEPSYASLRELTAALEYFERPDRSKVVAEVYARYEQTPAPPEAAVVPPLELVEEASGRPKVSPRPRRHALLVVAATSLTVVVLSLVWLWGRPEGRWLRTSSEHVSRAVTAAKTTVVDAANKGMKVVDEVLGAAPAPAPAPPQAVATAGAERRVPRRALQAKPLSTVGPRQGFSVASLAPGGVDPWRPSALTPLADPFLVIAEPFGNDLTVYTEADSLVIPPELVRPRLPSPAPGVRLEDFPRLEILVSGTGEVESVKLLSPGAGVHPAMMLSAVKNWRFQPATRAGQPVRYRRTLWLTR